MEKDRVNETLKRAVKHSFEKFNEAFLQDFEDSEDFTQTKKGYCFIVNNGGKLERYQIVYSVEKKEVIK